MPGSLCGWESAFRQEDIMANGDNNNWAAVAGAGAGLIAGVAALSLTGVLGRVQRNQGFWFAIALGLVVAEAALRSEPLTTRNGPL